MNNRKSSLFEAARRIPATTWWCIGLTVLALGLRLYGVSSEPLDGDEFGSVDEARTLGLNLNSIAYFVFMHWWIKLGTTELILRLPSVLLGAATVPIMCALGRGTGGPRVGVLAGLLTALSSFGIAHSQEVRFYSFFPFAAALAIFLTVRLAEGKNGQQGKILLGFSYLLVICSHFLGILVAAGCIASLIVGRFERKKRRIVLLVTALLFVGSLTLLMAPSVNQWVSRFYAEHANTTPGSSSPAMSGLSVVNFVKTGAALYFLTLGYSVYPLWFWIVVPALLLYLVLTYFGTRRLITTNAPFLIVAFLTAAFLGTYFVLDPIGGGWASGVSPRHVAFFWPVYILVISAGLDSLRTMFRPALFVTILLSLACLVCRWDGSWAYVGRTDWRSAFSFSEPYDSRGTVLIYDGRSQRALGSYYHGQSERVNAWATSDESSKELIARSERVLFVTNDYQDENRKFLSGVLQTLQEHFKIRDARVRYALFEYVLDRRNDAFSAISPGFRNLDLPLEIYDIRFQDLHLPLRFEYMGEHHEIMGQTGLPTMNNSDTLRLHVLDGHPTDGIFVFSNCTDVPGMGTPAPVARIYVTSRGGGRSTHSLRYGVETGDWLAGRTSTSAESLAVTPQVVCSWHKLIHLVGQKSYSGAWLDGQARIYGTYFRFDVPVVPQEILLTSRIPGSKGRVHFWGISLKTTANGGVSARHSD